MSTALWCALYLGCLVTVGYGAAAVLIRRRRSPIERLGMTACLGPGVAGLSLIALSMLGWRPNRDAIVAMAFIFGILGIFWPRPRPAEQAVPLLAHSMLDKGWMVLCLAAIAYGIFVVARDALFFPAVEWDAFSIWQLKGKVLAIYALSPRPDYFSDVTLSYSHLRYPVLVPMLSAGLHAMTGRIDDELGKTPSLLMYLGFGAVLYAVLKSWRGPVAALTASALFLTTPALLAFAGSGLEEMALLAFYGCSLICILRWQADQRLTDLILALLFTACLAWTKNEGVMLSALNVLAIFALTPQPLRPRHLAAATGFALGLAALYLPWILYTHHLPNTDENYPAHLNGPEIIAHLSRLPVILRGMLGDLVNWHRWGLFWIILPLVTLLQGRRIASRPIVTLWILLLLHLLAYVPPYMVTTWNLEELMKYSQSRLLLHATPAAALLIGLLWPTRGTNENARTCGRVR